VLITTEQRPKWVRHPGFPNRFIITGLLLALLVSTHALAAPRDPAGTQDLRLPPTDDAWLLHGEAEVGEVEGAPVLLLRSGSAIRPDITFEDGTIEFDFRPTDRRAFLGVVFRGQEDGTGEDIYLRLHKSGLADALQYTPDYRGHGQWQIFHGPDATAAARFRPREWQHARIEVAGSQAALFVGGSDEPQLVASHLRTGVGRGALAFWGNQPGASGDDPMTAAIRDILVRPGVTTYAFKPTEDEEALPGVIGQWGLAGPFARSGDDVLDLPPETGVEWRPIGVGATGVLELDRHVDRVPKAVSYALAGVRIRSDAARTIRLRLGFSDDASVFLNGRLLTSFRNAFSTNFPRRQGLLLPEQASVYLPLREGENQLVVAVSEIFGGWGLYGRISDRTGLTVVPLD
jgi:hypothetical protein